MHATEREDLILSLVGETGFVAYRDLEDKVQASPATIRRDLARLEREGALQRVHGGARSVAHDNEQSGQPASLTGTPFAKSMEINIDEKRAIGEAAAKLVNVGEGIIIDGGTTTFQMCAHFDERKLQVLTNSLHIVNQLLRFTDTQVLVPSGPIFREQNIILAPAGEASMPNFHASKLFLGAAAVSNRGIFQSDAVLVASQRRLLDAADEVILLVDSSKLKASSGAIVCSLDRIDRMITDDGASPRTLDSLREAGLEKIELVSSRSID